MSSPTANKGTAATPSSSSSSIREGSWRGSSDALLDAFETLLQEGDLSYTIKRHSGGKWSSEELLSSCQALLDDAREVVLSVESPVDSKAKRVKSWLKQTQPKQEAGKTRAAQANYILGSGSRTSGQPGHHPQRSSQAFERNIDNIFGELEVECDSARGKSVTNTGSSGTGNSVVISRPRSCDDLSDTDSYSSFDSYSGRFDPNEVLVSDSEDDSCFLQFESCSSGSDDESELLTDDMFMTGIDTGNEGDAEETTTDAGSSYSVFTTSAEELWKYNHSYGESSPSTMSPGLLTPPSLGLSQGSSDETLRALSALGSNSSAESNSSVDITSQPENKISDSSYKAPTTATFPAANNRVDVPRGIQGMPQQPQGHHPPRTHMTAAALSRDQPTASGSVGASTVQECTSPTAGDARMPQGVPRAATKDVSGGSSGGVVQAQASRSVSGTVPVEPPRREQQQQAVVPPPSSPPGPVGAPVSSSVADPAAASSVPRHWSNTIANLPHADSEVDFLLDHSGEDMADIFGGDTSTLKRKQHRDTVLFNDEFKSLVNSKEEHLYDHVIYNDGQEDDSLAYANVQVINHTTAVMEATGKSPPTQDASRIMRGRRPAPQPPTTPTPPSTPVQSPSRSPPLYKATPAASTTSRSPLGTPKPVHQATTSASSSGSNSPYSWVRLGPKRPAPLPPVFLPCKKAPAPPPPTGDSSTLKRKQVTQLHKDIKSPSNEEGTVTSDGSGRTQGPVVDPGIGVPQKARPGTDIHASATRGTATAKNQDYMDYSEIYSDLYGFKYRGDDVKNRNNNNNNGTLKKSKEKHNEKEKHKEKEQIYSKLGLSGNQFDGPIFGGDGSVVTKLGDEDFLVKTISGEEFLVTSIGGDEYLVSSINVDKDESKKTAEDISIIKNTDGIFSLKDKGVLKSSSSSRSSRVKRQGIKSQKIDPSGSRTSGRDSVEGNKDFKESKSGGGGQSVVGTATRPSSDRGGVRGSAVTEGRSLHSPSSAVDTANAVPSSAHTTTTVIPQHQHAHEQHNLTPGYKQVPPGTSNNFGNQKNFKDKITVLNSENINCDNVNCANKGDLLNKKSDYVTTIYVQDIESPTGVKSPVRNYGTVRATTVNTTNQDTVYAKIIKKNGNEKNKGASQSTNVGEQILGDSKGTSVQGSSRVQYGSGTVAAAVGRGVVAPCDTSECQVLPLAAAASPAAAGARRGRRPSGGHDAVRVPRDAPSQPQRPHADPPGPEQPLRPIGYATLLLGEEPHPWTYPVFGTVGQCQSEWGAPTQEWNLVVQGLGWGIVPCDSDLVLKYSDTMDGGAMHTKPSSDVSGANVNGIGGTNTSQSNEDISVHGFQIVHSGSPYKVNTLLPVFDSSSGCSSVSDMSGAVTYRVKPDDSTWHQGPHRRDMTKRNSDLCDMTMYRDPPLLPDAGGGGGPDTGDITPATSSRSIRLCGVALGAPVTTTLEANPFRRHTLPRKVRLSSVPPRSGESSPTPPLPPAQVSAPSSPKIKRPPVAFFPHQHKSQQCRTEAVCTDSGTATPGDATPTNTSPVSTPSQDSGCNTPTESYAYGTPPGGSAATTPSESGAYVTAAEVIIHNDNGNIVNRTFEKYSDTVTNNEQNVIDRLTQFEENNSEIDNSKRTHNLEKLPIYSVCIDKETSLGVLTSEPISPEPPPFGATAVPPEAATKPIETAVVPPEATVVLPDVVAAPHIASLTTTSHVQVSSKDCDTISDEHITHAVPTHLPQAIIESTINTLDSEKSVAVKCIHESSSNLCPLVSISNVATHKEVAILPVPAITLHILEDSSSAGSNDCTIANENVTQSSTTGNLEGIPPRLSRKSSDGTHKPEVVLPTNSDSGHKSMETMRSPTPSDLERRPSFNKIPTPFSAGRSNTLPRTADMSASLTTESSATLLTQFSDSLGHDKAKSASSLLSSKNTLARLDMQKSLEVFAASTKTSEFSKENNVSKNVAPNILSMNENNKSSNKTKSASSLVSTENNDSRKVRERSPLEIFATSNLQNEYCKSNISNANNQNVDCISMDLVCSDVAEMHKSVHSNSIVPSPGCSEGSSITSGISPIPSPLAAPLGAAAVVARCNQDDDTPGNLGNAQPQEIELLECSTSIEQTNAIATKTGATDATQIRLDGTEAREPAAVDINAVAAAAASMTPCGGDVAGTVQNMAAGGSIIIPPGAAAADAARDQADNKDEVIAAPTTEEGCQLSLQKQDTLQHIAKHANDVSVSSRPGCEGPGPPAAGNVSTQDTTSSSHLPDSGLQEAHKVRQCEGLVRGEAKSSQDIVADDVANSNMVPHVKPDLIADCDIIDLNYSQYDRQMEFDRSVLDTGNIELEAEIKTHAYKNMNDYNPPETNKINAAKSSKAKSIVIPNACDDELFISEDRTNIPVKGTLNAVSKAKENMCENVHEVIMENIENYKTTNIVSITPVSIDSSLGHENLQISTESTEAEKILNDSLSEGIRAISKSASFSSSSKPKGATISNCAALIALTGTAPRPQSHFPMDIICQSKKQPNSRQRLATTLGEPVEPVVIQRRRQSSLGHVDTNQTNEKDSHSERSRSASRIGYRHSTAFGETSNVIQFDLKPKNKSESHAKSNKDVRRKSPAPPSPQQPKPPFFRGKSFDSSDTQKKVSEISKSTSKDTELGTKTVTLSTKPPKRQIDSRNPSPLPPIRAAKEKDKKNANKESDDSTKVALNEKKSDVFPKEKENEVQLPLIHTLVSQNVEDLNREKELESMSQHLEDLQREKDIENFITHSETQISLPQPREDRIEVSTHMFSRSESEAMINSGDTLEVFERPTCVPSIEILDSIDNNDFSKKISLDSEPIYKNSVKIDHSPIVAIPIIIEPKTEDNVQENIDSGPSSLDQSQEEEVYVTALEIVEPTTAFNRSSTSITTVINVESSSSTSVTPTPVLMSEINQKATEDNEEQFEDASDELKINEKENYNNNFISKIESPISIVDQSSRESSTPCEEILHMESSQKMLEEPILLMSEEGSVSSGGVVTDPEMLASASASLSPASSWASNGGPVAKREYPLDEDEEELRWKALLAANEIESESGNDGCVSEEDFDAMAMDEEMRRLEEKLKVFENQLEDSVEPSCPSDNGQTSTSTSSRPLFKPEDIEGLRISPLPKVYPPPNMNRTKHFSLMSKMEIEQYGESETESDNSDNCSDDSADFLYIKNKLKLKPGDRRCRSHYLLRPKNMNILNSNKASNDEKIENKMDEELRLSGIVSQNDHNDTFDDVFNDKVDILPPQEFSECYEIPSDNPVKLHNIQERDETDSIDQQYEDIGDMREENIMLYGSEDEPLFGCMWYEDDGMTAVDFDGPEEIENYCGQGVLFFIFEDDLDENEVDETEYLDYVDYNTEETPQIISETKYIENVKEKEKSPKHKDSERTFVSAFKNGLRKASKYLGPKIDSNQKKRSRSASASRHKQDYNTEDITTKNMHLLPAPENVPERRRSAALDDYKDYSGVYNVRSGITRPNCGPTSDSEGPEISYSSGEYYASPALCVNTSDEDPSIAIPPPPTIPPPPLPPVPPPRWSRWEPTESPQSAGVEYGCWFENKQENLEQNTAPTHSTECNPNLDGNEMQFYLVGRPHNTPGNVYEDVQVTLEPEIIDNETISVEQIQTGAVYGEPYIKMSGWDPENCCDYEYIDTLACVGPSDCLQQSLECRSDEDESLYNDAQQPAPSHRPTSLKQLKRKQQEKTQRQEVEESHNNQECNTSVGVPAKRGRPTQEELSHGRQVSPHPKAIGDRRSWPPRK